MLLECSISHVILSVERGVPFTLQELQYMEPLIQGGRGGISLVEVPPVRPPSLPVMDPSSVEEAIEPVVSLSRWLFEVMKRERRAVTRKAIDDERASVRSTIGV